MPSFSSKPLKDFSFGRRQYIYQQYPPSPKTGFWPKFIILLILIVLLVFGAILASILIFGKSPKGVGERLIKIDFSGQAEVESLSLANYTIIITNLEISDLKASELKIDFPRGFVLTETDQPCSETLLTGCIWSLGKIRRGETKAINLIGYFLEPSRSIDDLKNFQGSFDFEFQDFSSHFQKEIKKGIFVKPALSVNLEMDEKVLIGLKKRWLVSLKNLNQQTIHNLKIVLETPNNFIIMPSNENEVDENITLITENSRIIWQLKTLEPLAEKYLYFTGYFIWASDEVSEFKITAGLIDNQGQFFVQNSLSKQIILQMPDLKISFSTTNQQRDFHWTDEIPLHLIYQNSGEQIEDLNFKIEILDGQFIDWQNLINSKWQWFSEQEEQEGTNWLVESNEKGKTIIWNSSQISNLNKVSTNDSGEIRFIIKLANQPQNAEFQEINFKPKVSGRYFLTGEQFEFEGTPLKLQIKASP